MSSKLKISFLDKLKIFFQACRTIKSLTGFLCFKQNMQEILLNDFVLDSAKHAKTPMSITLKLTKNEVGTLIKQTLCRNMISKFLCLTASRYLYFLYCWSVCSFPSYSQSAHKYFPIFDYEQTLTLLIVLECELVSKLIPKCPSECCNICQ